MNKLSLASVCSTPSAYAIGYHCTCPGEGLYQRIGLRGLHPCRKPWNILGASRDSRHRKTPMPLTSHRLRDGRSASASSRPSVAGEGAGLKTFEHLGNMEHAEPTQSTQSDISGEGETHLTAKEAHSYMSGLTSATQNLNSRRSFWSISRHPNDTGVNDSRIPVCVC